MWDQVMLPVIGQAGPWVVLIALAVAAHTISERTKR